jgi:hypothetical protein
MLLDILTILIVLIGVAGVTYARVLSRMLTPPHDETVEFTPFVIKDPNERSSLPS